MILCHPVIFCHWRHAMLSFRLSWWLSSVTMSMPCCLSDYPGGYLQSLRTRHIVCQIILGVTFSHWVHAMLSVRLSWGLSSITEDMPCCPSDYPGGYLQSLRTCHVIHQIILGVIFSHWRHAMLSFTFCRGWSFVTDDVPVPIRTYKHTVSKKRVFICYWWYTILAFRSCNRQSFVSHEVFVVFRILQR